jgi:hypothetical protein
LSAQNKQKERFIVGAPDNAVTAGQTNGWISRESRETFLVWQQHFMNHVQTIPKTPPLIILEGLLCHRELAVKNHATKHKIHVICIPPYITHELPPMD